jgi:hypothetical protein
LIGRGNRIDHGIWNPQRLDNLFIKHAHAARGDRAHRELFVTRHSQLPDEKDIEGHAQRLGDLVSDWHTSARQREHDHVRSIGVGTQLLREFAAGITAIAKRRDRTFALQDRHGLPPSSIGKSEIWPAVQRPVALL